MDKNDEKVLVVPAAVIFQKEKWQGLKQDNLNYYLDLIKNNYQFKRRGDVEEDPSFQQIIPYIVFNYGQKFFVYKYLPKAGEQRLVDSYQIGVGGHINEIDGNDLYYNSSDRKNRSIDILEKGMMREWNEEVEFKGNILEKKLIGFLYDDSRPVEAVHLGMVYNFVGDSSEISIKETDKMQGELVELKDIAEKIRGNDGIWIKVVYRDYLKNLIK
ncbi:MAG: hypothetical protein AAB877_00770 [Patescibacteria group bacterium]